MGEKTQITLHYRNLQCHQNTELLFRTMSPDIELKLIINKTTKIGYQCLKEIDNRTIYLSNPNLHIYIYILCNAVHNSEICISIIDGFMETLCVAYGAFELLFRTILPDIELSS